MVWFTRLMEKLKNLKQIEIIDANISPDWIEKKEWLNWEAPLNLVRGESYRQKILQSLAGKPRVNGYLIPVSISLVRDSSNEYDPNAIKVEIDGNHVGYIAREIAAKLAFLMDTTQFQSFTVPGIIRGGNYKAPTLGVHIWLDKRLSKGPKFYIDKNIISQYKVPWPPYEGEGENNNLNKEIYTNSDFPTRQTTEKPGYYLGKHYTEYTDTVKELKRAGEYEKTKKLLLALIEATESESEDKNWGVAPWYYEQLAIIYRKEKALDKELEILERFVKQKHGAGAATSALLERFEKVRSKIQDKTKETK